MVKWKSCHIVITIANHLSNYIYLVQSARIINV